MIDMTLEMDAILKAIIKSNETIKSRFMAESRRLFMSEQFYDALFAWCFEEYPAAPEIAADIKDRQHFAGIQITVVPPVFEGWRLDHVLAPFLAHIKLDIDGVCWQSSSATATVTRCREKHHRRDGIHGSRS